MSVRYTYVIHTIKYHTSTKKLQEQIHEDTKVRAWFFLQFPCPRSSPQERPFVLFLWHVLIRYNLVFYYFGSIASAGAHEEVVMIERRRICLRTNYMLRFFLYL